MPLNRRWTPVVSTVRRCLDRLQVEFGSSPRRRRCDQQRQIFGIASRRHAADRDARAWISFAGCVLCNKLLQVSGNGDISLLELPYFSVLDIIPLSMPSLPNKNST
jgi:hypothetical protein